MIKSCNKQVSYVHTLPDSRLERSTKCKKTHAIIRLVNDEILDLDNVIYYLHSNGVIDIRTKGDTSYKSHMSRVDLIECCE